MKKILLALISLIIVFNTFAPCAFAETEFKISEGSILNNEDEAPVSALITYRFTLDIDPETASSASISDMDVNDAYAVGDKLFIRLTSKLKYNTAYTADLSGIKSSGGDSLPLNEQTVSFKTKPGAVKKIVEEDFETLAIDTKIWRAPGKNVIGIAPMDMAADNGNYSYKLVDSNLDLISDKQLYIDTKAVLDFDMHISQAKGDYIFLTILGNDGNAANIFESSGHCMLRYKSAKNALSINRAGSYTDTPDNTTYSPTDTDVTLIENSWNKIRIVIDMKKLTFSVLVNGTLLRDNNDEDEFKIPFTQYKCVSQPALTTVRLQSRAEVSGNLYYDNISFRQYDAPKLLSSTIKENDVLKASCVELGLDFDSDVEDLKLKLNDEAVPPEAIKQVSKRKFICSLDNLPWDASLCLKGTVSALYNTERNFEINFSTPHQPEHLIEVTGFYDEKGDKLFALSPGNVTAKLKIWQSGDTKTYTIVSGVYKKIGDAVKMISLQSADYTLSASDTKTITVDVPAETDNCFMKIYVLDNSIQRNPYQQSVFVGSRILQGGIYEDVE